MAPGERLEIFPKSDATNTSATIITDYATHLLSKTPQDVPWLKSPSGKDLSIDRGSSRNNNSKWLEAQAAGDISGFTHEQTEAFLNDARSGRWGETSTTAFKNLFDRLACGDSNNLSMSISHVLDTISDRVSGSVHEFVIGLDTSDAPNGAHNYYVNIGRNLRVTDRAYIGTVPKPCG